MKAVPKPIATVPMIAKGMLRSGLGTSSAKWVAESRHAKDQLGLINPTMKAIEFDSHPVLLTKFANTNFAFCFGEDVANTVTVMVIMETSETYRKKLPTFGRVLPQQLKTQAMRLKIW